MKFNVKLTETVSYFAQIEADSLVEAYEKAKQLAKDNEFPNGDQELVSSTIHVDNGKLGDEFERQVIDKDFPEY